MAGDHQRQSLCPGGEAFVETHLTGQQDIAVVARDIDVDIIAFEALEYLYCGLVFDQLVIELRTGTAAIGGDRRSGGNSCYRQRNAAAQAERVGDNRRCNEN